MTQEELAPLSGDFLHYAFKYQNTGDINGIEVEVTEVTKNEHNQHEENFSDSQYLGMVTKWLRVKY